MNIDETKPNRQNRTITLHLGNTLAEYETTYLSETGLEALIRRVEIADSLDWGCLASGHKTACPRRLHFTHHDSYRRWAKHFNGSRSGVVIHRIRCLDCGAVFSVQPSFIIRYKRYETDATHAKSSGLATVNAWAITRNCWRFLKGAKRAGLSPLELAGADFLAIPWLQLVNLLLSSWASLPFSAQALQLST